MTDVFDQAVIDGRVERLTVERAVPLLDIEIERSGDGRTVTAYAATFGNGYPVRDADGDYDEIINRAAFNRQLGRGLARTQVLFNHGRNLHGQPSDRFSMPLGTPLEVRAEEKGLLTVTRYAKTDLADEVLELIRSGAIKAQSFRGDAYQSRRFRDQTTGRMVIERMQLGLDDYGPAPYVVNNTAEFVAVRSLVALDAPPTAPPDGPPLVDQPTGSGETEPPVAQPAEEAPVFDPGSAVHLRAEEFSFLGLTRKGHQ